MSWPSETLRRMYTQLSARPWLWGTVILGGLGLIALALLLGSQPAASPGGDTTSTVSLAVSVMLKLGAVLLLIYLCLRWLHRLQSVAPLTAKRQISLLETMHLSPRQKLHLVQIGGRTLLLGATEQSLSFLAEVDLPSTAEAPSQTPAESVTPTPTRALPFADFLRAWLYKG